MDYSVEVIQPTLSGAGLRGGKGLFVVRGGGVLTRQLLDPRLVVGAQ